MRSKLWWFTSAFLLWMAVAFVGLFAMVGKAFESLFEPQDAGAVVLAAGGWMLAASAAAAAILTLLRKIAGDGTRFGMAAREMSVQAAVLAAGSALAAAYGLIGAAAVLLGLAAAAIRLRTSVTPSGMPWRDSGLLGLAAAIASFVLILTHL